MSYNVRHWAGHTLPTLPIERFPELLEELEEADPEHPDFSVTHESNWCCTVGKSGIVILENLECGSPLHISGPSRQEILTILREVAEGRLQDAHNHPWIPGYG